MRIASFELILLSAFVSFAASQPRSIEAIKNISPVTYKLVHPLHEIEATSKDVSIKAVIDPGKEEIKSVSAEVDVMTFDSGNSNRDSHAMEVIDAITYPDVTFAGNTVAQAGDSITVNGKLTFHGVTKDITMLGVTSWSDDSLKVQGRFDITLTGFNIERPSLLMIPVKDTLYFSLMASFAIK
jgi:polyisoprenoid-binding protein YceI